MVKSGKMRLKQFLAYAKEVFGRPRSVQEVKNAVEKFEWHETYGEIDNMPVKYVHRGSMLANIVYLASRWSPEKELEYGVPEVAAGKWQFLSQGDYKTVWAAEDGNSDYVVKLYSLRVYSGADKKERAEAAAKMIRETHRIIEDVIGDDLLPVLNIVVAPVDQERVGVYKIQKRGLLGSVFMYEPEIRGNRLEESGKTREKVEAAKEGIRKRLREKGIDYMPLHFDMSWDLLTDRLVVFDIVDG